MDPPNGAGRVEVMHELLVGAESGGREQHLPLSGERIVAGRSAQCDIRLDDELASRRHFILEHTPAGWQVTDLGSTNGTLLNGRRLPPQVPVPLALSDRITVGHTTLVMRRAAPIPEPPVSGGGAGNSTADQQARQREARAAKRQAAVRKSQSRIPTWQWIVSAVLGAAVLLLAFGAFQPWVRIQVRLAFEGIAGGELLTDALSAVDSFLQSFMGKPAMIADNTVQIDGMSSYGWLTLLAAGSAALMLAFDLALRLARSSLPGFVYILSSLLPGVVLAADLQRFTRLGSVPILFGVNLLDIFQGASKILEPKVTPLTGLYLTLIGLALLVLMGVMRALLPALSAGRR
jgi:pSer/pThr/pTyr-binding forkhead associated (FHA) protein